MTAHVTRADLAALLQHFVTGAEQGSGRALEWFATDDFVAVCDALDLCAEEVFDHVLDEAELAIDEQRVLDEAAWLARRHPEHNERELAVRLGVSRSTLKRRMKKAGVRPRRVGRPRQQEAA